MEIIRLLQQMCQVKGVQFIIQVIIAPKVEARSSVPK